MTIRTARGMSDGIEDIKVTRKPDRAIVKYDDTQTSPAQLVKVTVKAGYGVTVFQVKQGAE